MRPEEERLLNATAAALLLDLQTNPQTWSTFLTHLSEDALGAPKINHPERQDYHETQKT
jgi:hypothetical protein